MGGGGAKIRKLFEKVKALLQIKINSKICIICPFSPKKFRAEVRNKQAYDMVAVY